MCHGCCIKKGTFSFVGDTGCYRDRGPEKEAGGGRDGAEAGAGGQQRTEGSGEADSRKLRIEGGQECADQRSRSRDCPEPALREEESQR